MGGNGIEKKVQKKNTADTFVKKIEFYRVGICTQSNVEFYHIGSNIYRQAQTGYHTYLGFFDFLNLFSPTLPIQYLSFVLMAERGKERLTSPPFDKRKEVRT